MLLSIALVESVSAGSIDFNRDIRPILSEHCFTCHGFDDQARKARLRLDIDEAARSGGRSGHPAIVPHDPEASLIWQRIMTEDLDEKMPPVEQEKSLSDVEKQLIHQWLQEGAEYQVHWAFVPPSQPDLPSVKDTSWPNTALDYFILAKLEAEGFTPQPEAEKALLARRVTLDLTGLPPTSEALDAFLSDSSETAYEDLVDRLLASPHYGERMALEWLDAARYADTHGYHIDSARDMTAWRDGVIQSFNENQSFDQFTIEQIAGDLIPEATTAQKVASGFNRNHMINYEGGAIAEEYHTAYIMDRINTTTTVWLGLTMACAQCHDHKYDPVTMKDYYALYALFNNVPERGLDGVQGNADPILKLPSDEQQVRMDELKEKIRQLDQQLALSTPELDAAQAAWEAEWNPSDKPVWTPVHSHVMPTSDVGNPFERLADGSFRVGGTAPAKDTYRVELSSDLNRVTAVRVDVLPDETLPENGPGRHSNGNFVLTGVQVNLGEGGSNIGLDKASAHHSQDGYPVSDALNPRTDKGWATLPHAGQANHAVFSFIKPYVRGDDEKEGSAVPILALAFQSNFSAHQFARFKVSLTDHSEPHGSGTVPESIQLLLARSRSERSEADQTSIADYYRKEISPWLKQLRSERKLHQESLAKIESEIPSTMVMAEMEPGRETFLLVRGEYDQKGDRVEAATPAVLPPLQAGLPRNRLGLAHWLVSDEQPLTARVIVNRYWQMYFGNGLVKTSEDFGSQGDWPTHPELLDWLATEFVQSGWDVKALQKQIVMSATYRQASAAPKPLYEADPENALYARGARLRLHAEFIRDLALSVSGLLNPKIGGESVFPYQPAGLWEELMSREDNARFTAQTYVQDHGEKLYRRSMYTFMKRTSPHPVMSTLDAPDRQVCTVRRPRTNTPLQALILMNDPTFVEASRKLAERVMLMEPQPDRRIELAFRLATGRLPSATEKAVLLDLYEEQRRVFEQDKESAHQFLRVGESGINVGLDPIELAAWAVVANAILNLDEVITKG
jgi:hypothetical protein